MAACLNANYRTGCGKVYTHNFKHACQQTVLLFKRSSLLNKADSFKLSANGIVLDPFLGSGTTMKVALELGRNVIGIELNPNYVHIIKKRVPITELSFAEQALIL